MKAKNEEMKQTIEEKLIIIKDLQKQKSQFEVVKIQEKSELLLKVQSLEQ